MERIKIYKAYYNTNEEKIVVDSVMSKVTDKQVLLDDTTLAWRWRKRFNKNLPLHTSEREALNAYIDEAVRTNRLLQARVRENQRRIEMARDML